MSDVINRAAQMIAGLAELETALRLAAAERDVLRARVAELEGKTATEEAAEPSMRTCRIDVEPLRIYLWGDAREMPYLRELPDGNFEKIYPADWPMPPGPRRPNIIRRREALGALPECLGKGGAG